LYFKEEIAQYVRIVGTHNSANRVFHLVFFEAYFKATIPKVIGDIICPITNVATLSEKAMVIEGKFDEKTGYYSHTIGKDKIILQLTQPYMLSSMKLRFWDGDGRSCRYFIETSVDKSNWKIAADRRNEDCKSWQTLQFDQRPVVYIRITGTHNTANNTFHCIGLECPASSGNK
jgi:BTB/POZ domain-containing protein 9